MLTLLKKDGEVLIRVKAFGLNRSELFTRQGLSPISVVKFPRILGIEAAGIVEKAPGNEQKFRPGDAVATAMGGMGREFDGGYAEYTCVPVGQVQALHSADKVPWDIIGALPEMMQTAWGTLFTCLKLEKSDKLLIRGATTSVGLAAMAIAKDMGVFVAATSRKPERHQLLLDNGADRVFIDDGKLAQQVQQSGLTFNKVVEMVGITTTRDSLQCVEEGGILCVTGAVDSIFAYPDAFNPMMSIPTAVYYTTYHSSVRGFHDTPLDQLIDKIAAGKMTVQVGKVFHGLESIVEAHRWMEEDRAGGKIVVVV